MKPERTASGAPAAAMRRPLLHFPGDSPTDSRKDAGPGESRRTRTKGTTRKRKKTAAK
jgi:hypothetical protein